MRENEATLGRLQQQGVGMPSEERERERERERWSLLRAARDEADRSLSLAASLADKEAALSHAHATIKEVSPFFFSLVSLHSFFLSSSFFTTFFLSFSDLLSSTRPLLRTTGSQLDEFNLSARLWLKCFAKRVRSEKMLVTSSQQQHFSPVYAMTVA